MTTTDKKTYSIFGAGAAGLYTAWRLLNGDTRTESGRKKNGSLHGDELELFDWGNYDFTGEEHPISASRVARLYLALQERSR